jgi:protein Shroom
MQMMQSMLDAETLTDYTYFIHMKQKLLVDAHEIQEKLQLGREQLTALQDSLREK